MSAVANMCDHPLGSYQGNHAGPARLRKEENPDLLGVFLLSSAIASGPPFQKTIFLAT